MENYKLPLVYNWELAHKKIVAPITPTTYEGLLMLISKNSLVAGAHYGIIDYQTIYDQPDYDGTGTAKPIADIVTKVGPIEPLIVLAVSATGISIEAYSAVYPLDIIWYDITFTKTEYTGTPAKGRIIRRQDDEYNLTGYDHRHVMFKRYESAPASTIFNSVADNGNASKDDIPTFGIDCESMNMFYMRETTAGFDDPVFIVPNNVFGDYCEEFYCGQDFYNNTIGSFCYATSFNHWCHNNIIGDGFYNNSIQNEFRFNSIGSGCIDNAIGNYFSGNIISNNFQNNKIGNSFGGLGGGQANVIGDGFTNNVIGNIFQGNEIGTGFTNNTIVNTFVNHNVGSFIDNDFQNNNIKVSDNASDFNTPSSKIVYDAPYCEVVSGFSSFGVTDPQNYLSYLDTGTAKWMFSGL